MPETAPSIEQILAEAVEIADEAQRAAFVRRACGSNAGLRKQLQELIDNHFRAGDFLETPPSWWERPDAASIPLETPGMRLGPYTLREVIGDGGRGMVYVAEQEAPIRRKVALKIIKPGMDSRAVIARFEAERQALALMDHPHIAKVLDAGATENGRPYFVMELVRGVPITQYCDESLADPDKRLSLFVQVCQAIQHAHQKGIIHRDIKPSNVLVTLLDGEPVPKVIDFGVAKAIGQRLTEETIYTAFAQMIGTPLYMSPEQADISSVDVDTRSDVYSLGVLLYELLTGTTPFDRDTVRAAGWDEMRRMLRETEPPRPSARVTTLESACTSTCPRCRGEPRKLIQRLRGELDWIVMKALEKDRSRRYQTARGLAADVQRYLDGEAVEACPPSVVYRLRKLAGRHKAALAATVLVLASLIVGTALSVWQAFEAHAARRLADTRLENEQQARRETAEREARLRQELYATDLNRAWRYWQDGELDRCSEVLDRQRPASGQPDLRGFEWHYLERCLRRETIDYTGHTAPILTADVSPDDRWVAGGDCSGVVTIWELTSGQQRHSWQYSSQEVCRVRFSPDGRTLATAGQDRTLRLWDTETWQESARFEGHERTIYGLAWSPDGQRLATGARDHSVRIWDVAGRQQEQILTEPTDVVRCVAWSPDGELLAAAGADLLIRLWDTSSWQPQGALQGHHEGLLALTFSPDGRWLASGGYNTSLIVHDCQSRTEWARIRDLGNIWSLAFSPDSRVLAVGGSQGRLGFWELTGKAGELRSLRADVNAADALRAVVFAQNGRSLLIAPESDQQMHLELLPDLIGRDEYRFFDRCLAVDYQRGLAATANAKGKLRVRTLGDGQLRFECQSHTAAAFEAVFSPQGTLLASCGNDGAVCLHDVATGQLRHRLPVSESPIRTLAFSPDGRRLAGGNDLGKVDVWRTETGEKEHTLSGLSHKSPIPVAFSPDGHSLAAGTFEQIALWDVATGRLMDLLTSTRRSSYALAISPDGAWLAAGGDGSISFWDVAARREAAVVFGHRLGIYFLAFSPDGRTLASTGADQTVRLWHVASRRELFTLLQSDRPLAWLDFASPQTLLVGTEPDEQLASEVLVFGGTHEPSVAK